MSDAFRLMIVEDEAILAAELAQRIRKQGWEVVGTADNADAAIALAVQTRPDVVLMDIHIRGERDGIDTAVALWHRHGIGSVFLTAYADEPTLARARSAEPLGYLVKPVGDLELATAVQMAVVKSRLQTRLRDQEQWLSAALVGMQDALLVTDAQARIRLMNPVAGRLAGWDPQAVAGYDLDEVVRLYEAPGGRLLADPVVAALKTRRLPTDEQEAWMKDLLGHHTPVRYRVSALKDGQGAWIGAVLLLRDVTAARRAEDTLRRNASTFAAVIDSHPEGMLVVETDGRITSANAAACNLLGREADRITGRDLALLVVEDDRPRLRRAMARALDPETEAEPAGDSIRLRRAGKGESPAVRVEFRTFRHDDHLRLVCRLADATREHLLEERAIQAEQTLDHNRRFHAQFLAHLAHDLRNPMTAIQGFTDLLATELTDAATLEMVDMMRASADRMMRTLDTLGDLVRLERGDVELKAESFSLPAELEEVARELKDVATERNLRLRVRAVPAEQPVVLDRGLFRQAMVQLVRAGLFMTMKGGVDVAVNHGVVTIKDTGIGLSRELRQQVFEPYATRKVAGDGGLGLPLAKRILDRLGAEISVDSIPGIGTTFKVVLPSSLEAAPDRRAEAWAMADRAFALLKRRFTILVVEDDTETRHLLQRVLAPVGQVRTASSLKRALSLIDEEDLDLVLADIQLETDDAGFRVLERVRQRELLERPFVVAITAHALASDRIRFEAAGFDGYLAKPFDRNELLYVVKSLLLKR